MEKRYVNKGAGWTVGESKGKAKKQEQIQYSVVKEKVAKKQRHRDQERVGCFLNRNDEAMGKKDVEMREHPRSRESYYNLNTQNTKMLFSLWASLWHYAL